MCVCLSVRSSESDGYQMDHSLSRFVDVGLLVGHLSVP